VFGPTQYLHWARRFYGQVRFDLASSGMPAVPLVELGVPSAATLDDPRGWPRLREAIARYNAVPTEEAVPALGTSHALWLAYASLTSPGDEVLVEEPTYEPLLRAAEGVGGRVRRFARDAGQGFVVDPDTVARAMTPATRVVALTSLHNPTGVRADDHALRAIAREVEKRGAYLLVDEVYAPFDRFVDDDGAFHGSARALGKHVVSVGSLTKCYGLGNLRVGWLLGTSEVARRADDAVVATAGLLPLAHAHMALHAFAHLGGLAARSRSLLSGKRGIVEAWARARGFHFSAPREGPFGLVTVPGADDLLGTVEVLIRDHQVLVTPGCFFDMPSSLRVAWTAPADTLAAGLDRLTRSLEGLAGHA
jgi:aspartate/methionine/tyrosine aminotransferase